MTNQCRLVNELLDRFETFVLIKEMVMKAQSKGYNTAEGTIKGLDWNGGSAPAFDRILLHHITTAPAFDRMIKYLGRSQSLFMLLSQN